MLMPKKVKHRKQMRGRMTGVANRGSEISFGEYGLKSFGAGLDYRSSNRSRPNRDDATYQARRQSLDPDVSRQAGNEEAGGNAHG